MSLRIDSKPQSCGWVYGGKSGFVLPMAASEIITANGGNFVKKDASGYGTQAGDGDGTLAGSVDSGSMTTSSTAGATKLWCIADTTARFIIPLRYDGSTYTQNWAETLRGKTCDLIVVSNVQYANLTTSDDDTIIVYDGYPASSTTANDGFVLCSMVPSALNTGGVA